MKQHPGFWYYEYFIASSQFLPIKFSEQFVCIAGKQLWENFVRQTGIDDIKRVFISNASTIESIDLRDFNYKKSSVSEIAWALTFYDFKHPIKFYWKSKSGKIYTPEDTAIDENDITFWFEDLDPLEIHKMVYPNQPIPFKLKNLTYKLSINSLNMDLEMIIQLSEPNNKKIETIKNLVLDFIDKWNEKSEEDEEDELEMGLVHNSKIVEETNELIHFNFDMGSADINILKKLLQKLNKVGGISKIEID